MHLSQFTAREAVCHEAWLQAIHARAVDRLTKTDWRHQLIDAHLELVDAAGWPALQLVTPLARPDREAEHAYQAGLATVMSQAVTALVVAEPPDPESGGGLTALWRRVLARLRGSVIAMALWDARLVSVTAETAVVELPRAARIPYLEPHLPELADALSLVVGQRMTVELRAAGGAA